MHWLGRVSSNEKHLIDIIRKHVNHVPAPPNQVNKIITPYPTKSCRVQCLDRSKLQTNVGEAKASLMVVKELAKLDKDYLIIEGDSLEVIMVIHNEKTISDIL